MKHIKHIWGKNEEIEESIDVDVKPVMNMFVILIPFLVSMAVFSHIAVQQFYLPPDAANSDQTGKIELKSTIVLDTNYFLITLGADVLDSIPVVEFDAERLVNSLILAREQADDKEKAIISARDAVKFDWVVRMMDLAKEAGFEQTGLSSAPDSAEL
jgi:biopolymer transport protein ExbD